nr:sigma-70 family RNA polymerase sigma factor [Rhodococcus sp. HNM0569]
MAAVPREHRLGSAAFRNAVECALPLSDRIAMGYAGRGQSAEELRQVAYLGLVQAVLRFDTSQGTPFVAYAVPTIRGEIRRFFRDCTWPVHVSRHVRDMHARVGRAVDTLCNELGRAPRVSELAEHLGMPHDETSDLLLACDTYRVESLDTPAHVDSPTPVGDTIADDAHDTIDAESRVMLQHAIRTLTPQRKKIVYLRFVEDLTQSQIAKRVGCSQMQISRELRSSLSEMRSALAPDATDIADGREST